MPHEEAKVAQEVPENAQIIWWVDSVKDGASSFHVAQIAPSGHELVAGLDVFMNGDLGPDLLESARQNPGP